MSEAFVSRNAFAKLEGCDEKQVRRGIERGVLKVNAEGKLDVAQVGNGWRKPRRDSKPEPKAKPASDSSSVRRNVRTSVPEVRDDETPEDAAARIVAEAENVPDLKESLARKEYFNALLKELEYREKDKALVEMALARSVMFEEFRRVRDAWLNWPAKYAAVIAADLGVEADRMTEALTAYVNKQLAALGEPSGDFEV